MFRCNNCMAYFTSDDDLISLEDQDGFFNGCPCCKTDALLMDNISCVECGQVATGYIVDDEETAPVCEPCHKRIALNNYLEHGHETHIERSA